MNGKYSFGKKIKERRLELGLTQKALAADRVTRNMLSLIESGTATPSLDTLEYLAERLSLPLPYLFSEKTDLSEFTRDKLIVELRELFSKGSYKYCLERISASGITDDEIELMATVCSYECGNR